MHKTLFLCAMLVVSRFLATGQTVGDRTQFFPLDFPHPNGSFGDTLFLTTHPAEAQFFLIWRGDTLVQEWTWTNGTNMLSPLGVLGVTNGFLMQQYSGDGCPATYQLLAFREDGTPFLSGTFGNCNEMAAVEMEWPEIRFRFDGMKEAHRKKASYTFNANTFVFAEDNAPKTDTARAYVIELQGGRFVGLDSRKKFLYEVFLYDNGPDYAADGLFRIVENGKIGYADALTGKVVIAPRFSCAYPFENGVARVSTHCTTRRDGEHSLWESDAWEYIDKTGQSVKKTE